MITLYGIKNCDTVKKARKWLESNAKDYKFHDFRTDGLPLETLNSWLNSQSKDTLINKRSTTWKQLSDDEKALFSSDTLSSEAKQLILAQPTLIKRPVTVHKDTITVGFKDVQFNSLFN